MQFTSKLRLIFSKNKVSQFLFQDSPSCKCSGLQSNNVSKDGKTFVQWLEFTAAVSRKAK
jgi:hypothetical protein